MCLCVRAPKHKENLSKNVVQMPFVFSLLETELLVFHSVILKMAYKNACQSQSHESNKIYNNFFSASSRIDEVFFFQMSLCTMHVHGNFHYGIHVNFPLLDQAHLSEHQIYREFEIFSTNMKKKNAFITTMNRNEF